MKKFHCTVAALAAALSFLAAMPSMACPVFDPNTDPFTDPCPLGDDGEIVMPGQDTA